MYNGIEPSADYYIHPQFLIYLPDDAILMILPLPGLSSGKLPLSCIAHRRTPSYGQDESFIVAYHRTGYIYHGWDCVMVL